MSGSVLEFSFGLLGDMSYLGKGSEALHIYIYILYIYHICIRVNKIYMILVELLS